MTVLAVGVGLALGDLGASCTATWPDKPWPSQRQLKIEQHVTAHLPGYQCSCKHAARLQHWQQLRVQEALQLAGAAVMAPG